jgi:hypothetical protein
MTKHFALLLAACASDPTIDPAPRAAEAALFPADSHPYGTSLEGWAERWWQWGLGIPLAQNPNDTPNVSADIHQGGPVYFLPNPPPGSATTFTVPRHTAAAVLLSSVAEIVATVSAATAPSSRKSNRL